MRLSTSVRSLLLPSELAQQHCPRAQLSPQAKGGLGEAAPLQVSGVEGFSSESGDSQSSLKQSFAVVWGFHLHKCVLSCSFVSYLGFNHEIDLP